MSVWFDCVKYTLQVGPCKTICNLPWCETGLLKNMYQAALVIKGRGKGYAPWRPNRVGQGMGAHLQMEDRDGRRWQTLKRPVGCLSTGTCLCRPLLLREKLVAYSLQPASSTHTRPKDLVGLLVGWLEMYRFFIFDLNAKYQDQLTSIGQLSLATCWLLASGPWRWAD